MDSSSPRGQDSSRSSNCTTTRNSSDVDMHNYANIIVRVLSRLDDLPDDTLLDIFLRLPAKTLHCSKSVSKRWLSLISAPCFARSYNRVHPCNNVLYGHIIRIIPGYVIRRLFGVPHDDDMNKISSSMCDSLLPTTFDFIPALRLDRHDHNLRLLPHGETKRVLVSIEWKGSSAGLILVGAHYRDGTDTIQYIDNCPYYIYYVCNPITKQWVELPLISTQDLVGFTCYYPAQAGEKMTRVWANDDISSYGNYDPNKIEYTVVSINRVVKNEFIIRVFSSTDETAEWRIFRVPFPPGYKWKYMNSLSNPKVAFCNGKFHWTGIDCIAAYDPFNKPDEVEAIPLPPTDDFPEIDYFAVVEGCLRVGTCYTGRFTVWELYDYANKLWVKKYDVDVKVNSDSHVRYTSLVAAAGEKGYVAIVEPSTTIIMVFDMKNGSLQPVYDPGFALWDLELYISSPWPTPIPPLLRKKR